MENNKIYMDKCYPDIAVELFRSGYNCCQSVVLAFKDLYSCDEKTIITLTSGFGGGMARLREVCGTCTGAFMVAGLLWGPDDTDHAKKSEHYALIQRLAADFKETNGSIICRELLGLLSKGPDIPVPEKRTESYYLRRPCEKYVRIAAEIVVAELNKRGK